MSDSLYLPSLLEILEETQLEKFWNALRDDLQITQIQHFDFVQSKDLEKIGMSKPAIRRLLDKVEKCKKMNNKTRLFQSSNNKSFNSGQSVSKFNHDVSSRSKLYNSNIVKSVLKKSMIEACKSKMDSNQTTTNSNHHQSVLIRSSDIQVLKDTKGEDQVLGIGHFGIVKKATWHTHPNLKRTVAVKFLHNQGQDSTDLINEIACMCGLDHENLIKLHGIVLDFKQPQVQGSGIVMVTELAANGSLYNYLRRIRKKKNILPVKKLYSYVYQISNGMEYLEMNKLIHRDLACRNILLSTTDQIKICDFGMTRNVNNQSDGSYMMTESHKIPCAWYPPESIRNKLFSSKSDVWMFGVSAWEIFTLCDHPWTNLDASQILNAIEIEGKQLAIPYLCSRNLYQVFQKCWSIAPVDRPSFQAIKNRIQLLKLVDMRAKENFSEENKLDIMRNDQITIIEGSAGRHWWKGQNQRTLLFGQFPRAILDPQRQLTAEDISLPLKNSFIHTGHMSAQDNQKNWGQPGTIDEIFLNNPLDPPDLIDDSNINKSPENVTSQPVQIVSNILSRNQNTNLINLMESTNSNETQYQDYSLSIDSFSSTHQSSSPNSFNNTISSASYNQQAMFDLTSPSTTTAIFNKSTPSYMNEQINDYSTASNQLDNYYYNDIRQVMPRKAPPPRPAPPRPSAYTQAQKNQLYIPNQCFNNQQNDSPQPIFKTYKLLEINEPSINQVGNSIPEPIEILSNSEKPKLDDFLNKVMHDVLNDFDNVKLNYSADNNR